MAIGGLLTRLAVLQAALETVYNTPQSVGDNDGFLISNPTFTIKPNVLERNFVRNDLSPMPIIIGRKVASMTFETELRSNGVSNTGPSAVPALITRLFQACGYAITSNYGPAVKGPYDAGTFPTEVDWDVVGGGATADGVWTAGTEPTDGQTVIVGNKTYTFKTVLTNTDGFVLIGGSAANAALNLVAAVNLAAGGGTTYAA